MTEENPYKAPENKAENAPQVEAQTSPGSGGEPETQQQVRVYSPHVKPVVTWVLIGISVLVYAAQFICQKKLGFDLPLELGAKYGPLIREYGQWWRLITPIFLHGSITHILFNMYALFTIGPELERYYGHLDYLLFYLISGFAGNVMSYIVSPESVSVGASTALFGLIAAQGFMVYKNRKLIRNYQRVITNILLVVGVNLLLGLQEGIDNWGHLGGLIAGIIMAYLSGPVLDVHYDQTNRRFCLKDTVSKKNRYASYAICTALFIALAVAF